MGVRLLPWRRVLLHIKTLESLEMFALESSGWFLKLFIFFKTKIICFKAICHGLRKYNILNQFLIVKWREKEKIKLDMSYGTIKKKYSTSRVTSAKFLNRRFQSDLAAAYYISLLIFPENSYLHKSGLLFTLCKFILRWSLWLL